jgi:sterol desaturase/sphingolipid hydroxylase (fatty acid hydroxylase superfamily)
MNLTDTIRNIIDHQVLFVLPLAAMELTVWWRKRADGVSKASLGELGNNVGLGFLHLFTYVVATTWMVLPWLEWVRTQVGVWSLPHDGVWVWLACLLLMDFLAYCLHRTQHSLRPFWLGHSVHHSATVFNYTVGPRMGVLDNFERLPFFTLAACLGFHGQMIVLCYALIELWSFWTHTEVLPAWRFGGLSRWFNTPSHHRVHHGSNPVYLDKNFGEFTMIWDHVFGTWQPETEPVVYGAVHMPDRQTPWACNILEPRRLWRDWLRASGWRAKFKLLLSPP